MGFIDWLTKDKDVKEDEQNQEDTRLDDEEDVEENNFNFDDEDLSSLKELSNSERTDTLNYGSNGFGDNEEEENNDYSFSNSSSKLDDFSNNYMAPSQNASFTIFKVCDEEDVRQVLRHLSGNSPCIASFKGVRRRDFKFIMKYLQGGLFVMGANMSEWQNDSYILVPKGMAINMQEKTRRKK